MYCCIVKVEEKKLLFPFDLESGQNRIYFSYFSVWENEQLACVHDYMFRIVGQGFDELVDHDIAWIEDFRWYASFDSPEEIEARIARGLFAVRDMVEAKSYEQMLKAYKRSYEKPSFFLLDHGLSNSTHGTFPKSEDHEYWLEDFSEEEDDAFIKKPVWCDDEDEGPELIWRWAHSWFHGADFVLCEQHRFEREWGYVMWDYARILQLRVMENEWTKTPNDVYVSGKGSGPPKESLERKWKIYRAGGRGWWSADDESKVVWRGGCAPWDKPVEILPDRWEKKDLRSIDEAKDFIKKLRLQLP
ncbi:zinc finger domain-containing protein [Rutstroemia sp. NJR-2017a BBW]|nr:zinc finger domain-containing protein [Rutstroemia sp. NJR-2017a BBW]